MRMGYAISTTCTRADAPPGPTFVARLTGLTAGEAHQATMIGVDVTGLVGGETVVYQWQQDGSDIADANAATELVELGTVHTDDRLLSCVVAVDGQICLSDEASMRHPPITAGNALADRNFIVGAPVDLDLTGGFTLNGNTPSYAVGACLRV